MSKALVELGNARKARLEDALKGYQFFSDLEVEELFIKETEQLASSKEVGKDFASLTRLRKRHEVQCTYSISESLWLNSCKTENICSRVSLWDNYYK